MAGYNTCLASRAALNYLSGKSNDLTTPPRTMYLMLLTVAPPSAAPTLAQLTEVTDVGYARQAVTWTAASSAITTLPVQPSQTSNSTALLFGPFTGSSGLSNPTLYGALVTASTGTSGSVVWIWQWDTPGTAAQNESVQVSIGALVMTQA